MLYCIYLMLKYYTTFADIMYTLEILILCALNTIYNFTFNITLESVQQNTRAHVLKYSSWNQL